MNADEIEQAVSGLAEQPFDREEFPFQFRAAFGNKNTMLKRLRSGVSNKSDVGEVLKTNNIHIASCAPGQTLAALRASAASAFRKGRFKLATDVNRWMPLVIIIPSSGVDGGKLGGKWPFAS